MSEMRDARYMLEKAEHAATSGDLSSAYELLRNAARIQEAELGPLHPDLANTLNNLAIVAEKTGRPGDAETFYRRAAAIAAASLPPDHPMVAASRENLEDFCRAHGLPIDRPALETASAEDAEPGLDVFNREDSSVTLIPPPPTASQPLPPAPHGASRSGLWAAIGVAVLAMAALLLTRPWSSHETSTPATAAAPTPTAPPTAQPATPTPAPPAPIKQVSPPNVVPRGADRSVASETPRAGAAAITLTTVQLCQTFSTSGGRWRCEPASDSVAPGPLVLYTRVRSPRDAAVVHRWYRGDALRQSVTLTIRANATEGYRTYSRQSVNGAGDWRVEVRSVDGNLLHEQRFAVR